MDLNYLKEQAKEKLKSMEDSRNIVFSLEKEVNDKSETKYRAYNVFGEEIEGYFCDECIKAHPEQYDFSIFNDTPDSQDNSPCSECNQSKIIIERKENEPTGSS